MIEMNSVEEGANEIKLDITKMLAKEVGIELEAETNEEAQKILETKGLAIAFNNSIAEGTLALLADVTDINIRAAALIAIEIDQGSDGLITTYKVSTMTEDFVQLLNDEVKNNVSKK